MKKQLDQEDQMEAPEVEASPEELSAHVGAVHQAMKVNPHLHMALHALKKHKKHLDHAIESADAPDAPKITSVEELKAHARSLSKKK